MEYNGKVYWTAEEIIEKLEGKSFNELHRQRAFGLPLFFPDAYDGLVYDEENFTPEGLVALGLKSN